MNDQELLEKGDIYKKYAHNGGEIEDAETNGKKTNQNSDEKKKSFEEQRKQANELDYSTQDNSFLSAPQSSKMSQLLRQFKLMEEKLTLLSQARCQQVK